MDTMTFLMLLATFSTITGLVVECIKKIVSDKANISYNVAALIIAMIVGVAGCGIYYQLNNISFSTNNIIYMILMGLASALSSTLGYDKVVQTLRQCKVIKEDKS